MYIACSYATVWLIYSKFKATYDGNHDTFRVEFLVVPTAVLAFLVNHDFTPLEVTVALCPRRGHRQAGQEGFGYFGGGQGGRVTPRLEPGAGGSRGLRREF